MVEVASSNLAGPTKFLSLCFSGNLFFAFAESPRVVASSVSLDMAEVASSNLAGSTKNPEEPAEKRRSNGETV